MNCFTGNFERLSPKFSQLFFEGNLVNCISLYLYSVGVICYVLLSGLSPFMGDTDIDTMTNVTLGKYNFDDDAFKMVSDSAKEFIRLLLQKDGR